VSETKDGKDGVCYLKLADGRGWVFDKIPGDKGRQPIVLCRRAKKPQPFFDGFLGSLSHLDPFGACRAGNTGHDGHHEALSVSEAADKHDKAADKHDKAADSHAGEASKTVKGEMANPFDTNTTVTAVPSTVSNEEEFPPWERIPRQGHQQEKDEHRWRRCECGVGEAFGWMSGNSPPSQQALTNKAHGHHRTPVKH
jgi:hypothetical protein